VGMSWAVFWNFLGSGFLALFVPRGLAWSSVKLFGLFTGFSFLGFLLVYFFVPGINKARSLEEMTRIFQKSLIEHSKEKVWHIKKIKDVADWFPYKPKEDEKDRKPSVPTDGPKETAQSSNEQVPPTEIPDV